MQPFAIGVLALFLFVGSSYAQFECYSCNSATSNFDCKDNYGDHEKHIVTCNNATVADCHEDAEEIEFDSDDYPPYLCFKKTVEVGQNKQVSRSCIANCARRRDNFCELKVESDGRVKTNMCFCTGTKCNSGVTLGVTLTLMLAPLVATIYHFY